MKFSHNLEKQLKGKETNRESIKNQGDADCVFELQRHCPGVCASKSCGKEENIPEHLSYQPPKEGDAVGFELCALRDAVRACARRSLNSENDLKT